MMHTRATRRGPATRYPPLVAIILALALVIFALPSALNLPVANPGQTLEYAPVPGNSGQQAGGNLAGLGLGAASTGPGGGLGGAVGGGLPPPPLGGQGTQVSDKACVGSPPRQTEDPLSPPCIAYFGGDNGGATYTGVTGSTVTVLFRMDASSQFTFANSSRSPRNGPPTGYYDMDNPNDVSQFFMFSYLHDWEVYFNKRYQTYHREVHFLVHNYDPPTNSSYGPSDAQSDAADTWTAKHPFATLQLKQMDTVGNFPIDYADYLADRGALSFGSYEFTQAQASKYPGLFWSYPPALDSQAQEYASFVCQRVVKPGTVSFSGNNDHGKPRKYGLLLTRDPSASVTQQRQKLSVQLMQQECGIQFADTEYFNYSGGDTTGPQSGWGVGNVAGFEKAGVTTVIWPGGGEVEDTRAASQARWYPEWVLEGDGYLDSLDGAGQQAPDELAHAWVTTSAALIDDAYGVERPCLDAIQSVDPNLSGAFADYTFACMYYDDLRQLFTGIQLAGPKLTPAAMNQGFHAIPPKPSTSPYTPSCYYLPGDYTCVKDAAAEWYDPNASTSTTNMGCWRMWRNGQRYLIGQWPAGDVMDGYSTSDVCNLYDAGNAGYSVSSA